METKIDRMTQLLASGKKPYIAIIGDVMLDKYIYVDISRICPEAPCPIATLSLDSEEDVRLGGAANVAANLASLGGKVELLSVAGEDESLSRCLDIYPNVSSRILQTKDRPTTTKTRILSTQHNQIALRVDKEVQHLIADTQADVLLSSLEDLRDTVDYFIISDYGKGVITPYLINGIKDLELEKRSIVDPNYRNLYLYKDFFLIKPNVKDLREFVSYGLPTTSDIYRIQSALSCSNLIVTLASEGAILSNKEIGVYSAKALTTEVTDVTGAGDTVTAAIAFALAMEYPTNVALDFSMLAAGAVIRKQGTSTTTLSEIIQFLEELRSGNGRSS